jgi:CheY-like chemotaxis protein
MTARAAPPSVLVVEDESLLRMMAVDMFTDAGFRVIEAESADEGARLLADDQSIDGLFTDVEMPGAINGFALAKIARGLNPSLAILIVSGRLTPSIGDVRAPTMFVGKPYDSFAVLGLMNEMIAHPAPIE